MSKIQVLYMCEPWRMLNRLEDLRNLCYAIPELAPAMKSWFYSSEGPIKRVNDGQRIKTMLGGVPHSFGGEPAVIHQNGDKEWWCFGVRHRGGGKPAIEYTDGTKEWWINGQWHRDGDMPAITWANGTLEYWTHGKRDRSGNKPAIVRADGTMEYWVNDEHHRDKGEPAIVYANGNGEWWIHNKWIKDGRVVKPSKSKRFRARMKRVWRILWGEDQQQLHGWVV